MIKERYSLLDAIRGFAIVNMVLYHTLYDIFFIFGFLPSWYNQQAMYIWEQCICIAFIIVCGMCRNFSKHNLKQGITLFVIGGIISLITFWVMPQQVIWFGILSFLGCAILIMIPLEKLLKKINPLVGCVVCLLIFLFIKRIDCGYVGIFDFKLFEMPKNLYFSNFIAPLGFPTGDFFSSDYFPILPWMFVFLFGYFLWRAIEKTKVSAIMKIKIPVLDFLGRHSLLIYVVHQPLCYGILYLIFVYLLPTFV